MRHQEAPTVVASIALLMLCAGNARLLQGQTLKATILGTITDSSHAVIPGAQVVVTETNTNAHRTEITNDSGFYVFANMDPGTYRVDVEQPGFRKVVRSGIDLTPNTTARIDLELSPGEVSEIVDVTAEAPLLQTDRADTSSPWCLHPRLPEDGAQRASGEPTALNCGRAGGASQAAEWVPAAVRS